jgi:hypothetical protein
MTSSKFGRRSVVAVVLALPLLAVDSRDANACGCFTPPDPSVPIVQAGERILFAMENGVVTAHIQIQYAGDAQDFGWLLPLPSVPEMELGTDELFAALTANTQPKYRLVQKYDGNCGFNPANGRGGQSPTAGGTGAGGNFGADGAGSGPLVIQASVGPYDYAVLKADSQADMLKWLADNRYFVPAGTDQTVGAYIRPGAFFLALKLQSGKSAGDLQPVVVRYPADIPVIPIVLTSVAAQPNMGIQVWMLGAGRAIPRNYFHTVINDMAIDWSTSGANYNDVIIKAVGEAPEKHSFVTEYAGDATVMRQILNRPGRFGSQATLAATTDAVAFVQYLQQNGFGTLQNASQLQPQFGSTFTTQLLSILERHLPIPASLAQSLAAQGQAPLTSAAFFQNLTYYRQTYPSDFAGWPGAAFNPTMAAAEIFDRIVKPTLDAGALFDKYPKLTRLYTTLSPQDMNKDPAFSFNASLPAVSNVHEASLTYYCGAGSADRATTPALLITEQGWSRYFESGTGATLVPPPPIGLAVRRLEVLREEGAPEVVTDNPPSGGGCGCSLAQANPTVTLSMAGAALALAMVAALSRSRRRRRQTR